VTGEAPMKALQMTIDEPQLTPVDHVSQALKLASQRQRIIELECFYAIPQNSVLVSDIMKL
jgi:hypothetical protein